MTQLVQEPLVRFFKSDPPPTKQILCTSTGKPLEPLECFCCSGAACWHREGSYLRLWNDVRARPWRYVAKPWVFELTPMLRRLKP